MKSHLLVKNKASPGLGADCPGCFPLYHQQQPPLLPVGEWLESGQCLTKLGTTCGHVRGNQPWPWQPAQSSPGTTITRKDPSVFREDGAQGVSPSPFKATALQNGPELFQGASQGDQGGTDANRGGPACSCHPMPAPQGARTAQRASRTSTSPGDLVREVLCR